MPVFQVTIEREVKRFDTFTRFIEADTREEAEEAGERLADDAQENGVPDDASETEGAPELGDWYCGDVTDPDEDFDDADVIKASEAGR